MSLIPFSFAALGLLAGGLVLPAAVARPVHAPPHRLRPLPPVGVGTVTTTTTAGNGILTRDAWLWRQPAKIEPHIQQVDKGRSVQVVGRQGNFYAVILHNGRRGWLPADAVRAK